jgi:hypothetical protein
LRVQIHTLNEIEQPTAAPVRVPHATLTGSCGLGWSTSVDAGVRLSLTTDQVRELPPLNLGLLG